MASFISLAPTSSNYDLEFPSLPRKKQSSPFYVYVKNMSGDLFDFEITKNISHFDFYKIVYQYLSSLPDYQSLDFTDLILYRCGDGEKENQLLDHRPLCLNPKKDEIFIMFIEPLPSLSIYADFTNESIELSDNSGTDYRVICLSIQDTRKSYPDNRLLIQDYLVRCPTSEDDLLNPQIWSMDHINVTNMRFGRWEDIGSIDNPDPSLVINDPTQLIVGFTLYNPYFSDKDFEGFRRHQIFYSEMRKNFDHLMRFYLTGDWDSDSDSDSDSESNSVAFYR